jgi:hypothetical protein
MIYLSFHSSILNFFNEGRKSQHHDDYGNDAKKTPLVIAVEVSIFSLHIHEFTNLLLFHVSMRTLVL